MGLGLCEICKLKNMIKCWSEGYGGSFSITLTFNWVLFRMTIIEFVNFMFEAHASMRVGLEGK